MPPRSVTDGELDTEINENDANNAAEALAKYMPGDCLSSHTVETLRSLANGAQIVPTSPPNWGESAAWITATAAGFPTVEAAEVRTPRDLDELRAAWAAWDQCRKSGWTPAASLLADVTLRALHLILRQNVPHYK